MNPRSDLPINSLGENVRRLPLAALVCRAKTESQAQAEAPLCPANARFPRVFPTFLHFSHFADHLLKQSPRPSSTRFCGENPITVITAPFRYLADPLFLSCCALYLLNRFYLRTALDTPFLANHFNDLLLVPCAIPVLLWFYKLIGLRPTDEMPRAAEILPALLIWSLLFEFAGPHLVHGAVGDGRDVAVYWLGGIAAWCCWHFQELSLRRSP